MTQKPTKPKPKKAPQKAVKVPPKKREVKKPIRKVIGITPPPKPPRGVPRKKKAPKESLDQMIDRKYDEHKTATKNRKFLEGILESSDEDSNAPISLVGKKDIPTRVVSYKELMGGMDKKYKDSGRLFPSNYLGAYVPETEFNLTTVGNNLDDRLIAVQEAVADMDIRKRHHPISNSAETPFPEGFLMVLPIVILKRQMTPTGTLLLLKSTQDIILLNHIILN